MSTLVSLFDGTKDIGKIAYALAKEVDRLRDKVEDLQIAKDAAEEQLIDHDDRLRELETRL